MKLPELISELENKIIYGSQVNLSIALIGFTGIPAFPKKLLKTLEEYCEATYINYNSNLCGLIINTTNIDEVKKRLNNFNQRIKNILKTYYKEFEFEMEYIIISAPGKTGLLDKLHKAYSTLKNNYPLVKII